MKLSKAQIEAVGKAVTQKHRASQLAKAEVLRKEINERIEQERKLSKENLPKEATALLNSLKTYEVKRKKLKDQIDAMDKEMQASLTELNGKFGITAIVPGVSFDIKFKHSQLLQAMTDERDKLISYMKESPYNDIILKLTFADEPTAMNILKEYGITI